MSTIRYSKDHEYIRVDGDTGVVGITEYAQQQLGDVVFVELPAVGKVVKKGGEAAVVESVKAASEVYAPVSGEIVAVNAELEGAPGVARRPGHTGFGWSARRACSREHHQVERPPTVPCTMGAPSRGQVPPGWRAAMMRPVCAPPLALADSRTDFSAR